MLGEFACRDGAALLRRNAYVAYNVERSRHDQVYRERASGFHSVLCDLGYKIVVKEVRWYQIEIGR